MAKVRLKVLFNRGRNAKWKSEEGTNVWRRYKNPRRKIKKCFSRGWKRKMDFEKMKEISDKNECEISP